MTVERIVNDLLIGHRVSVKFTLEAKKDLANFDQSTQEQILALIVKRAISGPLIKPKGLGQPLGGNLCGLTKIKPKAMTLRIIYKPIENNETVLMQIIAIGPRDKNLVYKKAIRRLTE
jgi:mRNA interferase RelE/StbE